jgi:hypothetical protein
VTSRPLMVATLAVLGCAMPGPASPAEAYARALDAGRLDAAYALTTTNFRATVSSEEFHARYPDAATRSARARAVREGLAELARAAPELYGAEATERPEAVILRFASAIHASDFEEAWRCLGADLQKRYTVDSLSRDFRAEPGANSRLSRALLAAEGTPTRDGDTLRFPVAGGGAVTVLHQSDGWRLEALE